MKKLKALTITLLIGSILFSSAGCSSIDTASGTNSTLSEITEASSSSESTGSSLASQTSSAASSEESDEEQGDEVETTYYSVVFPESIQGLYESAVIETGSTYSLNVYDKASVNMGADGFVFSICLYESKSEYESFPDYDVMGTLTINNNDVYYVVMQYATDVAYVSSTAESWQSISSCAEDVKASLKANSSAGAKYTVADESNTNSSEATGSSGSTVRTCTYCKGLGHCAYCTAGKCYMCSGLGGEYCSTCSATGHCPKCGTLGYYYTGNGTSFRKVTCTKCKGLGICSKCSGTGFLTCSVCNGSRNCQYCGGIYFCQYCGGTGILEY